DGDVVPCAFAAWRMAKPALQNTVVSAAAFIGERTDARSPLEVVTTAGRLEHAAAFTAVLHDGRHVAVPAVTPAPGLRPETAPRPSVTMLGRETAAMAIAFVLPATATAIAVFARHVARVSSLDEFELPLPHNLPASFALMIVLYL